MYETPDISPSLLLLNVTANAQHWTQVNPPKSLFNNSVFSIAADASGKIYAAGAGTDSAGEQAVAVLENGSWKELGVSTGKLHAKGNIYALTTDVNGNLYAAGMITDASGRIYVAKWNGSIWSETDPASSHTNFTGIVFALDADAAGNIYAAGEMIDSLGFYYVTKFNGTQWQQLGKGAQSLRANGFIYAVRADKQGNVYVAGNLTNASGENYVAKWDGTSWSELGTGVNALHANSWITQIQIDAAGNVYAGGDFKDAAGFQYVAKWNGSSWSDLGTGASALKPREAISAMYIDKNDHLFVGCQLANDSTFARSISQWNGSSWVKIQATAGYYFNNTIRAITSDPSGNLYTAGDFTSSWGEPYVAEYSSGVWSHPGDIGGRMPGQSNPMKAMAVDTGGHIFVILGNDHPSGASSVVRWNGRGWDALPEMDAAGLYYNSPSAFAPDSLGNMYAIGNFFGSNGLARWDGSNWTPIPFSNGTTAYYLNKIATDKKGNVYLTAVFSPVGFATSLVKWDGINWSFFVDPGVISMLVDPQTDAMYATGGGYTTGYNVVKIEGDQVTDIGAATAEHFYLNANNQMTCLALDGHGNLYAAGSLEDSSGNPFVARWDGSTWTHLESDTSKFGGYGQIEAIALDKNGNLFAGGDLMQHSGTYIGEWNGNSWITVGDAAEFWFQQTTGFMGRDGQGNVYAEVSGQIYRYTGDQAHSAEPVCSGQYRLLLTVSRSSVTGSSASADIIASGMPSDSSGTYSIEFASDREFTHRLQSANNNKLTLSAADLHTGQNIFYGRMTILDMCGNSSISIDSVSITKTADGGIIDADFPNTPIVTYPNPVLNEIHVSGLSPTKSYTIEVYNSQGNKVAQVSVTAHTDAFLNAQTLEPGVYSVQVYDSSRGRRIGILRIVKGGH